jgi:hypothetical protein
MGRWILWGWVALAVIVVGLVLGFVLYTRIVIGIGLQDQRALLHLPETLIVQTRAEEEAAITLRGRVEVDVPFKHDALPLPLKGTYKANLALDTMVPLRMTIEYEDVIPIETTVAIEGDTKLISEWLPRMPIEGELPLKLEVPVSLKVPVDTQIRYRWVSTRPSTRRWIPCCARPSILIRKSAHRSPMCSRRGWCPITGRCPSSLPTPA